MFNVIDDPIFTRTVEVKVPKAEGFETQTFEATFRAVGDEDSDGLEMSQIGEIKDLLRKRIVSFGDLADGTGEVIEYSEEIREKMISLSYVRLGLLASYNRALTEALTGN